MTLHVIYSNATGSTTDLTALDTVRLPGLSLTTNAEEGSVAVSTLTVDDVGGALNLVGHRRVYIYESAEDPLNQMIWTGFLGERAVSRGPGAPRDGDEFVLGADRRWTCAVVDVNTLASRRIVTGSDGNRPAETDVQRIAWLIGTNYVFTVGTGDSAGYFNRSGGVALDAADLRGQTGWDVFNDCAQHSGKNWFIFYDEGTDTAPSTYIGHMSLFYDFATSATYSSTLRLTNVNADVDNSTTFAVNPDAALRRDPGRVYSGIYLPYEGGVLYQQDTATGNAFAYRDTAAPNANVKSSTKAGTLAIRYLNDAASEDDRIDCRFVVPKQKVNHLREGQRVQIKFSHLPSYSSGYTWARVLRRTVTQLSDDYYEIAVELAPNGAFGSCSYVAPVFPGSSSVDVLGASLSYNFIVYNVASPVYASTTVDGSGPEVAIHGTPNNGAWGTTATVTTYAQTITMRYVWDLLAAGLPRICKLGLGINGRNFGGEFVVAVSDDGVSWSTLFTAAQLQAALVSDFAVLSVPLGDASHRYWSVSYSHDQPGGLVYYPGFDLTGFLLWGGSLT